jgi:hypothetical protein
MDNNQAVAITGLRGPARELPENSGVRLTIDIDPNFVKAFHDGFRIVGQAVSISRLAEGDIRPVMGVRRPVKEMPDGTLRVTVDIDPAFRSLFFEEFKTVGEPVAMVAIAQEAANPVTRKGGRLTRLAGEMCRNYAFRLFVGFQHSEQFNPVDEDAAAVWLRHACEIDSRRDLDYLPEAAKRFQVIQSQFVQWAETHNLEHVS